MGGLDYLSEREWVIFTIEEELGRLVGLVAGGERLSPHDRDILADCRSRLDCVLAMSASTAADDPLPRWLRRKSDASDEGPSGKRGVA